MRGVRVHPLRAGLVLLLAGVLASGAAATRAQHSARVAQQPARQTPLLRHDVLTRLGAAQREAEAGRVDEAERLLAALEHEHSGGNALNAYELANVHNFRAYLNYMRQDFPAAIRAWEQVLAQPGLPRAMEQGTRYSLAQLYVATSDWRHAATMLEAWFRLAPDPAPESWALLAQARYQLGEHDEALRAIGHAFDSAQSRGQPMRENWYLLQRMASFAKGDLPGTVKVLEVLAQRWPRKEYFVQLAGILGELGDSGRQLAVLETAYRGGWLGTESELLDLAYLYLGDGTPIRAARLLERGMKEGRVERSARNLELLGTALHQARENHPALEAYERAAALAKDADLWVRVASLQLEEDASEAAVASAGKALGLGGGRHPDSARMVLGTALYRMGRYREAREAFAAAATDQRSRGPAGQWLRFLDAEIARSEQLARDLGQQFP